MSNGKNIKMKRFIIGMACAITIGVFLSSGTAFAKDKTNRTSSATKGNVIKVTVEFPAPIITKLDGYDHIEMEGIPSLGNTGEPVLPVKGVNVLIPAGKDVKSSEIILGEKVILPGKYNIEPAQQPVPLSYEGKVEKTLPKDEIYKSRNPYPKDKKEKITTQRMRGYRVEVFKLCPIEYIPQDGIVSYYKSITLKVNLEKEKKPPKIKEPKLRKLPKDKKKLQRLISNTQDISSYDTLKEEPLQDQTTEGGIAPLGEGGTATLLDPADSYQYVVITNEALKNASGPYNFQALCAEKNARDITTNIVTTEWIYANYDGTRPDGGTDNATKIRNFIIDAYNNWETEYILLGGDATGNPSNTEVIPCRKLFDEPWPGSSDADELPSDIYYCCLDGTMDYDADGIYGEKTDGDGGVQIDFLAEVYIGRAPIVTVSELANFVNKTISYNNSFSGYLLNTYMLGEWLGFGGVSSSATASMEEIRLGSSAHEYTTAGFASFPHFQLNTLYDEAPPFLLPPPWLPSDLINIINNGVHILNHLGHAWIDYDMKLSNSDADSLTNTEYFFGYSQGCYPGAFDEDCILEHFVKNSGGAFAFVGNSRYGWGEQNSTAGPSQYFDRQFWDAVFDEGIYSLGAANEDSKEDNLWCINYSSIRWCYLELNLFGDPETQFRLLTSYAHIRFDKENYQQVSTVNISLIDTDLNVNPLAQDTVTVYVSSDTTKDVEGVILTETGPDTSFFEGHILLNTGTPQVNGILEVSDSDNITVIYYEANPLGTKTDTAKVDSIPPLIQNVQVSTLIKLDGTKYATITWETDEPSTGSIYYGENCPPENSIHIYDLVSEHSITISNVSGNATYYFAVESVDVAGNTGYDDNEGAYYDFIIVPPSIEVTPAILSFDVNRLGSPNSRMLTITNTSEGEASDLVFEILQPDCGWITVSPDQGSVPPGASTEVRVLVRPPCLPPDQYSTELTINNTSLTNVITVPVTMNLLPELDVRYDGYRIIDDWSGRSYGVNGDRHFNPGERIELQVELINANKTQAKTINATLSLVGQEPYINILDNTISGTIPPNTNCLSTDTFLIEAAAGLSDSHTINFMLDITDDEGQHGQWEFQIKIMPYPCSSVIENIRIDRRGNCCDPRSKHPQISCDSSGNVYVVWGDARLTRPGYNLTRVFMNHSSDYGNTWAEEDRGLGISAINAPYAGWREDWPEICADENGDVYVTAYGGYYGAGLVMFDYSHDYATRWLGRQQWFSGSVMSYDTPQISCNENGGVYIVSADYSGTPLGINMKYSLDYGNTWQSPDRRFGTATAATPRIAATDNGHVYLVWREGRGAEGDIYFNYSHDFGLTWQPDDLKINADAGDGDDCALPQIYCDSTGHVYIAWENSRDGGKEIYFDYSEDFGATWQANDIKINADTGSSYYCKMPQICCDNAGHVYVTWHDNRNGKDDIYFDYSEDYGATWLTVDIPITEANGIADTEDAPSIICGLNEDVYIAWSDKRNGKDDIYLNYSLDNGATWQSANIRIDDDNPGSHNSYEPKLATDGNGIVYIVWYDNRGLILTQLEELDHTGNPFDIYFSSFSAGSQPVLESIGDYSVSEGTLLEFNVVAHNPTAPTVEIFLDTSGIVDAGKRANIESDATFIDHGDGTATFNWIPYTSSAGTYYPVVFVARDPSTGKCDYQAITIGVTPEGYTGVLPDESIQEVADNSLSGGSIYIFSNTHEENLYLQDKNLTIKGENASNAVIKGNILLSNSDSSIENLSIEYAEGDILVYSNAHYTDFKLLNDAGITAVDSEVTVKNCIIQPDPTIFGTDKYGKGIQIWNLYGSSDINPTIEDNLILNAETGISLFSQVFGGAILGAIQGNELQDNTYGIVLRMHKEKPIIDGNTISYSTEDGIRITYEDGTLLTDRLLNISNNHFIGNTRDVFCDELDAEVTPTGPGNTYE